MLSAPLDLPGLLEAREMQGLLAIQVLQVQRVAQGTLGLVDLREIEVRLGLQGQWVALAQQALLVVWERLEVVEQQVHQDNLETLEALEQWEWWVRLAALETLAYLDSLDYLARLAVQVTRVQWDQPD